MPVTDDQLVQLIHDLSATVPAPTDLSQRLSAGLQRRHRRRWIAVAASTVVLAASVTVGAVFTGGSPSLGHGTGVVPTPADPGNPAAAQLLGWPTRGDLAADRAYVTSATTAARSVSSNSGTQIRHDTHALYVGTVPGGRTAAFVEGIDGLGNPMVVALSGIAGHTGFHAYGGQEFTESPDISGWAAAGISLALARPDSPGFALVVGAPGTTAIDLSIAPRQHGGIFGPVFHNLPLADGVGAIRLPAGADPLSVFYTVEGPHARSGFFYPAFTSSR
jgi:hypothetical protein